MKILFVLEYYYPHVGGVEKLFKQIAELLVQENHEVQIVTNSHSKDLPKNEILNGVKIKRLHLYNRFLFTFLSIPYIIQISKNNDLIHTTSYNAAFPSWIAAKIRGIKTLITFHEVWGKLWFKLPFIHSIQKFLYYSYEWFILKLAFDGYIAVSDSTKSSLITHGIRPNKIKRVYNGIEYKKVTWKPSSKNDPFEIAFLGRLGISKGLDILIPALKEFIIKYPHLKLKLITPKTPKSIYNKVNQLIKRNKLINNTIWLHELNPDEVQDELLKSSCLVIPSYSEGFCFVAAEASALNMPIISSDQAALKEVVSGRVIKMDRLNQESIIKAIEKAINQEYEEIPLKKFNIQEFKEAHMNLYQSFLTS